MPVYQLEQRIPTIDSTAFVAPSADIIGSVMLNARSSIWFNAVARGDNELITIGENSSVQDNTVLHTDPGMPLVIGDNVTIGHSVMLHSCQIGSGTLIGIGSIILNNAEIGENCLVGANTLITEGKKFPPRSMIVGSPGKAIRQLTDKQLEELKHAAEAYVKKVERYKSLRQL